MLKWKKGEWIGGPLPFGYETNQNVLTKNTHESSILREVFHRASYESVQEVYDYLVDKGYRTRKGKSISRSTLYRMFEPQRIHIYLGRKYKTPLLGMEDVPEHYLIKYSNWLRREPKN